MKCRNTICWQVHEISYQRNILGFQRIPPRAEQVQSQPIPKEKRFLRFMHNKLRVCVKVLARVFPNKSAVVSLIFDYIHNFGHDSFSLCKLMLFPQPFYHIGGSSSTFFVYLPQNLFLHSTLIHQRQEFIPDIAFHKSYFYYFTTINFTKLSWRTHASMIPFIPNPAEKW